jgi:hypothetical protein
VALVPFERVPFDKEVAPHGIYPSIWERDNTWPTLATLAEANDNVRHPWGRPRAWRYAGGWVVVQAFASLNVRLASARRPPKARTEPSRTSQAWEACCSITFQTAVVHWVQLHQTLRMTEAAVD